MTYETALWSGAIFLVLYTSIGGFLAVNWVDFLQGSLMLFALLAVPVITVMNLGGFESTWHTAAQLKHGYTDLFANSTGIGIASLMAWGLGYFGQPHILVRFMAVKSIRVLPLARAICMSWMVVCLIGAIATGFAGFVFFAQNPLHEPASVFVVLAEKLFPHWLTGILLAAVLSAVMSTIAAQLLASSSSLTEDIYHRFFRKTGSQKELVFVSRLTVLLVALTAVFIAYNPKNSILELVSYAWAGLGASFGPVILLSLFWKRMTRNGAVAGILAGALGVIAWKLLQSLGGIFELYEILPAFIFSCVAIVIVSLWDKKPTLAIQREFQTMLDLLDGDSIKK